MRLACIAFAGGAWWVQQQAALPDLRIVCTSIVATATLATVARMVRRGGPSRIASASIPTCVAAIAIGTAWATWRAELRLADALPPAWEARDLIVTGTIASLPTTVERGVRFRFAVESATTADERARPASGAAACSHGQGQSSGGSTTEPTCDPPLHVPGSIALGWYAPPAATDSASPSVRPGQRWRLTVRLKRPHGTANPDAFDYEYWLLEEGLRATGYVRDPSPRIGSGTPAPNPGFERDPTGDGDVLVDEPVSSRRIALVTPRLLDPFVWSFGAVVERTRATLRDRMLVALHRSDADGTSAPYAGVLVALVVGDQRAIAQDDWTLFNRTGIGHLVSISGLHVSMIAALGAWLVFAAWRRRPGWAVVVPAHKAAAIAGTMVALVYCLLAGFGVPAQRTLYMIAVVAWALWMHRLTAPSRVLAAALALVVAIDPWAVSGAGFWLSFSAVAAIFYVTSGRLDALAARSSRRSRVMQVAITAARVQWAVTVALTPLTLLFFHQVSIVSPVANAIAIPVVSFVVTPLALVGAVAPAPLTGPILQVAHGVLAVLVRLLSWLASGPFAVWSGPTPAPWTFVLAVIGVIWMLAPRGLPSRWVGVFWCVPLVAWPADRPPRGTVRITALDIGQGTAVVVQTRSTALLYDTGPRYGATSDAGSRVVVPFLAAQGIARLDALVVSHNDLDHSGGALSVLAALPVAATMSSLAASSPIVRASRAHRPCAAGDVWSVDDVRFAFLHPLPSIDGDGMATAAKPNARSCVLRVEAGGRALLLTGDIEAAEETALLARAAASLPADVLMVPHHGSRTSSTAAFVGAVHPSTAIVQAGYRNRFGHPRPDVVARYLERGIAVVRNDREGAITITMGRAGIEVDRYRVSHHRYWMDPVD